MSAVSKCAICNLDYITEGPYPACKSPETLKTKRSQEVMKCVKQFDGPRFPSAREKLQLELAEWISVWATAPYGVLTNLASREDGGKGYARKITFGNAGTLDATVFIWSAKRLDLVSSRNTEPMTFNSVDEFKAYCVEQFGATA